MADARKQLLYFSARIDHAYLDTDERPTQRTDKPLHQCCIRVGLLTGGDDKTYALGLTSALVSKDIFVDFIGSSAVDGPELHDTPYVNFLNLRGDQNEQVSYWRKIKRILMYYGRLVHYAAAARPLIFHILWNNRFELLDRTVLMLYYRMLGKKIVLTAHNVNAAKRDSKDNLANRGSLRFQYWLADHIFVHTKRMKDQLMTDFAVANRKVSVIPFGINNTYPCTSINSEDAKLRLGLKAKEKVTLFFGQIAPYKGLEYLVAALAENARSSGDVRLVIAGKVKRGFTDYWQSLQRQIDRAGLHQQIIERIQFIPDEDVELYLKAADVLILPYTEIFQSGLPFLAYSFGLPVIASDVGALRDNIVEGKTGYVCRPRDSKDLARAIETYFSSDLYLHLEARRREIRDFANEQYSWSKVADTTHDVYLTLLAQTQTRS